MIATGGAISRVYATALFELAEQGGQQEETLAEVRTLLEVFDKEDRFRAVLESPRVEVAQKGKLFADVFGDEVSPHVRNLFSLLLRTNRHFFFRQILSVFIELYEESKGRIHAAVTTATPLTDDETDRLVQALSKRIGREVLLEKEVNPEMMGGAILRYGDYIVDGSLQTRMRQMKENLLKNTDSQGS